LELNLITEGAFGRGTELDSGNERNIKNYLLKEEDKTWGKNKGMRTKEKRLRIRAP